jgi:hypothetical protein
MTAFESKAKNDQLSAGNIMQLVDEQSIVMSYTTK